MFHLGRGDLWTAGFGDIAISPKKIRTDYLMHLEKKYITFADCQKIFQDEDWITIKESMICVQNDDPTKQACFGDSGGPLYDSINKKIVGVVSTGNDSCSGLPVIYTRLASHVSSSTLLQKCAIQDNVMHHVHVHGFDSNICFCFFFSSPRR